PATTRFRSLDGGVAEHAELVRRSAGDGADGRESLLELTGGVRERQSRAHGRGTCGEDGEPRTELREGGLDPIGAESHALIEAHEVALEPAHRARGQVASRKHEAKAHVVQAHDSAPSLLGARRLLHGARLAGALLVDAIEEPVAIRDRELESMSQRRDETGTAVLLPAQLKEALAPAIES